MRGIEKLAGCVVVTAICLLTVPGEAQTSVGANETATEELRTLMTTALSAARTGTISARSSEDGDDWVR